MIPLTRAGHRSRPVDGILDDCAATLVPTRDDLHALLSSRTPLRIQTVNVHHVYLAASDPGFRTVLGAADAVTADGWPIVRALRNAGRPCDRVTGSELVRDLAAGRLDVTRVAIVGARSEPADRAAELLSRAGLVVGYRLHTDLDTWDTATIARRLNEAGVELALVAVTPPFGEIVAAEIHAHGFGGVVVNVGGAIDMLGGAQASAPEWVQRAGGEWLHRLLHSRGRLLRRYLHDCMIVLPGVLGYPRHRRPRPAASGRRVVFHVGPSGEQPGGMAQVVNELISWDYREVEARPLPSARYRRDPVAPLLLLRCLATLLGFAVRHPGGARTVAVHLSERGSFLREGLVLTAARALGYRVVGHLHGAEFVQFAHRHPWLVRAVLRRAHAVAALTDESLAVVNELLGPDGGVAVHKIPNAVHVPPELPGKRQRLVFCGEVGRRKGADVLVEAWRSISAEVPGWELVCAGPPGDVEVSRSPGVTYLGAVPHTTAVELQSEAAIAVLPSRDEALPVFLVEAMARECCVVATRVGQIPELVGTDGGILVEPGRPGELADALLTTCRDWERTRRMGRSGRERVLSSYSEETLRDRVESIWSDDDV